MSQDIIKNQLVEPSLKQILDYMNDYARENWKDISNFFENEYKATPSVSYSSCSTMPGWNVKYKKGSKSLCTIYPDKEYFTILLVVNNDAVNKIMQEESKYSKYFLDVIRNSGSLNGCKWLMIGVDDSLVVEDIKRVVNIKNNR